MRSILYSFLLPKFYSFYLVELKIIFELFKSLFKSIFTKNLLIKIKLDQKLKVYLSSSIILYFFMIVLTLVSLIIHKDPDYFELIFIFKMVIYFILMPLFIERTLSRQFLSNLKIITILFFFLSALIFANSLSSNTMLLIIGTISYCRGRRCGPMTFFTQSYLFDDNTQTPDETTQNHVKRNNVKSCEEK